MRFRYELLAGFVAFGFTTACLAQQSGDATPTAITAVDKSPQVAALIGQFHILDAQRSSPVEVAPPGTIDDDSEISSDRAATDAPRRLLSAIR